MTVFIGSWERAGIFYKIATILAAASIVVTAVYILRAVGTAIWGTIRNKEFLKLSDARWNEKAAAVLLIAGIVIIGVFPFILIKLISSDSQIIFDRITSIIPLAKF
jgi:NADH-quinone oxidoreductase subunit M